MSPLTLNSLLAKIDYRLSPKASSRVQYQVDHILAKLMSLNKARFNNLVDIGGGYDGRYRKQLESITNKYSNLEVRKGRNVDLVGSVYKIPLKSASFDLVTMFMVLEHLNEPLRALIECNRVLKKDGVLAITTVQYWHTHSYPSDYYRYTKYGLKYLLNEAGFKIVSIWSHGGPFLVNFHSIELNLEGTPRVLFSILFYRLADYLDWVFFRHNDKRRNFDSVGWSVIAVKK